MKLSEAIQQPHFESVHTEAMLSLQYTSNWLMRASQSLFKRWGLSPEQYNILRILRGNRDGAYCLRDVQNRMLNRTANTTRLVEKLRTRGLVSRTTNPANRRMVEVQITEAGLDLLAEMDDPVRDFERRTRGALSTADAERLIEILERLREGFDVTGLGDVG